MAHVHGAAAGAAETSKHAAHAAHHAAHASHHAAHAAHASQGAHASHAAHAAHHAAHASHHAAHAAAAGTGQSLATHAAAGALVAKGAAVAGVRKTAGKSFLGKLLSHPVVLFGLGVAVGYTIHKYRKEIIHSANRAVERGQDFVLQQRENLEDLVGDNPASET